MSNELKNPNVANAANSSNFTPFLKLVADDLYEQFGSDLSKVTIIAPNKRASLFFNQYLAEHITDKPIWAPKFTTIGDVFNLLCPLTIADPIQQICKLYEAYKKVSKTDESLDKFYSWAELMKNDFEDIDNNLADAQQLFRNIEDLEELKDFEFLNENQRKAIYEYFLNYDIRNKSELKKRFMSVWQHLYATYNEYHSILKESGFCYSGMQKRFVVEGIKNGTINIDDHLNEGVHVIIGFNVLNETEKELFKAIEHARTTLFYWDYDEKYLHTEAGRFVAENIRNFKNRFADHPEYYRHFGSQKSIRFVKSPTENAQTRYVNALINNDVTSHALRETAIVLCNENILQPVLHSLPSHADSQKLELNVTMGYPLMETPIYTLLLALMNLQMYGIKDERWRYTQASVVLKHSYVRRMVDDKAIDILGKLKSNNVMFPTFEDLTVWNNDGEKESVPFLQAIFTRTDTHADLISYLLNITEMIGKSYRDELIKMKEEKKNDIELQLYVESIFTAHSVLQRVRTLQEREPVFNVNNSTLSRLLIQMFMQKSIPFHGEPAIGLQVMGLLETRNLDFRNVIMLSANEGNLPKQDHMASLIPYSLREAYAMTTIEKQVSLYAFYFYNLLQRAENVVIMYNGTADGLSSGEMSRFMMQMQAESMQLFGSTNKLELISLNSASDTITVNKASIEKTQKVKEKLREIKYLSPTVINTYINCPVRFYFSKIAGFREENEVSEGIDNPTFGSIFHRAMELIYTPFKESGKQVLASDLNSLISNKNYIEGIVDKAFADEFFKLPEGKRPQYNGEQLLNKYVITDYVKNQLKYDALSCPMKIIGIEENLRTKIVLNDDKTVIEIGGNIDRYEYIYKDGIKILRITDYKTNAKAQSSKEITDIFDRTKKDRAYNYLQALYYCEVMASTKKCSEPIMPALMYIKTAFDTRECRLAFGKEYVEDYVNQYQTQFRELLIDKLSELILSDEVFEPYEYHCDSCEFRNFCNK